MISAVFLGGCVVPTACGEGDNVATTDVGSVSAKEVQNATGQINVLGWQFYEDESAQDNAVSADWTYVNSDPDILTKARTGDFDVSTILGSLMDPLETLGVLDPIATSALTNYDDLPARIRDDPIWKNEDGDVVGVPYAIAPAFTAWDSSTVSEPTSLDDLLDPKYACGIALFDAPETIAQIAVAQGVQDTREMTEAQLDAAMAYLDDLRPNVKSFYTFGEDVQQFNRGDICVSISTFSPISRAIAANPAIKLNFLAEVTFIDTWGVLAPEENYPQALNWINGTLSKEGQEAIVKAGGAYPVNPAALPTLKALGDPVSEFLTSQTIDEVLDAAPLSLGFAAKGDGDVVTQDEATRAWNEYKGSF